MFIPTGRVLLAVILLSAAALGYGWYEWQYNFCHAFQYTPSCSAVLNLTSLALLTLKLSGGAYLTWVAALLVYGAARELSSR